MRIVVRHYLEDSISVSVTEINRVSLCTVMAEHIIEKAGFLMVVEVAVGTIGEIVNQEELGECREIDVWCLVENEADIIQDRRYMRIVFSYSLRVQDMKGRDQFKKTGIPFRQEITFRDGWRNHHDAFVVKGIKNWLGVFR